MTHTSGEAHRGNSQEKVPGAGTLRGFNGADSAFVKAVKEFGSPEQDKAYVANMFGKDASVTFTQLEEIADKNPNIVENLSDEQLEFLRAGAKRERAAKTGKEIQEMAEQKAQNETEARLYGQVRARVSKGLELPEAVQMSWQDLQGAIARKSKLARLLDFDDVTVVNQLAARERKEGPLPF